MRIAMLATGPFAAPTLAALLAAEVATRHVVVALVTKPPREQRDRYAAASPLRELAAAHALPVLEPESSNTPAAREALAALAPDLLVVCDYGQILSRATLAVAPHGGINLHGSLLPKYRGAAPINWAIYHGETETGVSVIHMTPRLDAGPCLAQARWPIGPDDTPVELEPRLAQLGAPLVVATIDALAAGTAQEILQDESLATPAPRLKKEDGRLDWSRPATALANQIRALQPWPRCDTHWLRTTGEPLRLIIDHAHVVPPTAAALSPPGPSPAGTITHISPTAFHVACGANELAITHLQPPNKRRMTTPDFLHGHALTVGERLG